MMTIEKKKGSGVHRVLRYPDPTLTTPARDVEIGKESTYVIKQLLDTMSKQKWGVVAGMAAPQIGYPVRLFIVQMFADLGSGGQRRTNGPQAFLNPRIIEAKKFKPAEEGCYSLEPGKFDYQTSRPAELTLEYYDVNGEQHTEKFTGHFAHVISHENDHLEGVLCAEPKKSDKDA